MRIPIVGLILLYVLGIAVDAYIYSDIKRYASPRRNKMWRRLYAGISILFLLALTVVGFWPIRNENAEIHTVMWTLYTYCAVYFPKLAYVLCSAVGRLIARLTKHHVNYGVYVGIPVGLIIFIVMWWGVLVTRYEIQVNDVTIESDRLPEAFDGFRITQFSDAHVGTWLNDTTFVSALVDSINATKPDMIVFTGDIVSRRTSELAPFIHIFSRLHAPYGVYSILGNHDYGDYIDWKNPGDRDVNNAILAAWERQMGWRLLNNESVTIGRGNDSIVLIGVENWGEPPFKQYGDLRTAYGKRPGESLYDDRYKILLSHNPEHWRQEVVNESNIDLTLSGHTHAMQAMFKLGKFRWSPIQYKYDLWGGLYQDTTSNPGVTQDIYINIGSGEVAIPARIGAAYPEVTVIELKRIAEK